MNKENDSMNEKIQTAAAAELERQAEEKRLARIEEKRKTRARVSAIGVDNPFDIPKHMLDPKMHYAIINDKPGHISDMKRRGYEFVINKELAEYLRLKPTDPIKFATGMTDPAWAYLMYIEQELFEEDQAALRSKNDEMMATLGEAPEGLKLAKDAHVDGVDIQKGEVL